MIIMVFGVALAVAASVLRYMDHQRFGISLEATAWITVGAVLAYVVARAVFAPGRVSYYRINSAVLLYLTIGQIFAGFYGGIDLLAPHAFSGLNVVESPNSQMI